jgi:hypothetical protein
MVAILPLINFALRMFSLYLVVFPIKVIAPLSTSSPLLPVFSFTLLLVSFIPQLSFNQCLFPFGVDSSFSQALIVSLIQLLLSSSIHSSITRFTSSQLASSLQVFSFPH